MKTMLTCALSFTCVLMGAATTSPCHAGELDGAWTGDTLVTMQGNRADDYAKTLQWVFDGEKFKLLVGVRTSEGKCTIDEKAAPKAIDIYASTGDGPQVEVGGIYKVDGDTLTVCYFTRKGNRPTEFKGGDDKILLTLKKNKKS